ncbi:MAG: glutamate synthase subunit beta [Bryobacteraceae bacterium]|nr:glutamate synthase subunit beta [Bryobacteraceae bacterium]MDW8378686.1 glutamate synthase subunit beta [Bryobacterales bacterium]
MGKVTGFLEYPRELPARRPVSVRTNDWLEIYEPFPLEKVRTQGARCMDCGVPFCHTGCPVHNIIPDWNDLVYRDRWREAIRILHSTNNFPEFTGRICPAPCEAACVLGINEPPVAIKLIERNIVDYAWSQGWIRPEIPERQTGKRVAIIGSGPAGLAAAQQLARVGHHVEVFEKADRIGGLLRYGIPDFKLEKHHIDRRLEQMRAEGVIFHVKAFVGSAIPVSDLRKEFHAILIAIGAESPRDLKVPGRELKGIHFAMDFLPQQNKRVAGDTDLAADPTRLTEPILATGKRVVIIGGGDTGADCLGTSHRHKAAHVQQFEILPMPPLQRSPSTPWPLWPLMLREESSHEEGGVRNWSISTTHFTGDENGHVAKLHAVKVGPPPKFEPIPGSEFSIDVDLVLLAMGFTGPVRRGLLESLEAEGLQFDSRGNIQTDENYMTSIPGIFAAGDARRGQSLVVWAISEGRKAARGVDRYLMGESSLPA